MTAENHIFELSGWLLSCADEAASVGRPCRHSTLRFIETVRKMANLHSYIEGMETDPFLLEILKDLENLHIEGHQMELLSGEIQGLLMKFANEALNRV